MEDYLNRYDILSKDIKHQIRFIDDVNEFDFNYFKDTLKEMEQIQTKIRETKLNKK